MIERSRRLGTLGIGFLVCAGAVALACTADDPVIVQRSDAGADAPDAGGGATDAAVAPVDDAGDDAASTPPGTCPTTPSVACGAVTIPYGSPALKIDACEGSLPEGYVTSWQTITAGQSFKILGSPGALYCKSALGGRPGLVFDKDGFTIPAGALPAADAPNGAFSIVAVLQYTETNRADTIAGGVVFERNALDYPNDGPSLITNFAFQKTPTDTTSLAPTNRVAGAVRFGVEGAGPQGYAIASTTSSSVPKPFVAIVIEGGQSLTLYIDGTPAPSASVPATFPPTAGNGLEIRIGHGARPGRYFLGTLSELVYYPIALNAQDVAGITTGLKTKWGIP